MRKKNFHEKWVWRQDPGTYTEIQKRRIIARVVQCVVEATFNTHVYKWAGQIFQQSRGGPIGLRASGTLAKAAMEEWIRKYQAKLESLGVKVHLLRKYVDDVVIIC